MVLSEIVTFLLLVTATTWWTVWTWKDPGSRHRLWIAFLAAAMLVSGATWRVEHYRSKREAERQAEQAAWVRQSASMQEAAAYAAIATQKDIDESFRKIMRDRRRDSQQRIMEYDTGYRGQSGNLKEPLSAGSSPAAEQTSRAGTPSSQ